MKKSQLVVISGIIVLFVLLLLADTKLPPNKEEAKSSEHSTPNSEGLLMVVNNAKAGLTGAEKKLIDEMEGKLKSSSDKKTAFENIINQWDSLNQPTVAAYYMEQAAIASPIEKNWDEAGKRYYASTRFAKEVDRPLLYNKAIECFEKTVQLNPNNLDAKINLGACYVEGSTQPMKGIGILKEVEKTDSNNVNLQLNFAFFSEKSGQWDKAIKRFEKVLRIQPDFIEAYLHLADAYQQMGDKPNAIKTLEKYITLVDDVSIKTEVEEYISKLKEK